MTEFGEQRKTQGHVRMSTDHFVVKGELLGSTDVSPSVRPSTISNIFSSETNEPISIKLYQNDTLDVCSKSYIRKVGGANSLVAMATRAQNL